MCSSGVGLTPVVDGKIHHFGAGGVSNGLIVLSDSETWSNWDHITGECFAGPLEGKQLEVWPMQMTTVGAAKVERPRLELTISKPKRLVAKLFAKLHDKTVDKKGFIPPFFYPTMAGKIDARLDKHTPGLGVIVGEDVRFYPMQELPVEGEAEPSRDTIDGRELLVRRGAHDKMPRARWADDASEPMQLLARWYGFSFTYPDCVIWTRG